MRKVLFILFGIGLCLSPMANAVAGEKEPGGSSVVVPEKGVTLVLRAPTRRPHLMLYRGTEQPKEVPGFLVSLSGNTPVFFQVDEVNTVLYSVKITAEEKTMVETVPDIFGKLIKDKFDELVKKLEEAGPAKGPPSPGGFDPKFFEFWGSVRDLQKKVEEFENLNQDIDNHLFLTETPVSTWEDFVKVDDWAKTQKSPEDIRTEGKTAIQKVHEKFGKLEKEYEQSEPDLTDYQKAVFFLAQMLMPHLPETIDSPDPVAAIFKKTAEKLELTLKAGQDGWSKKDVQARNLKGELLYTCEITPNVADERLKSVKIEVTVLPEGGFESSSQKGSF